jgi:hypothetical protein
MRAAKVLWLGFSLLLACSDGKTPGEDADLAADEDASLSDAADLPADDASDDGPIDGEAAMDGAVPGDARVADGAVRDASGPRDAGRLPPGPAVQVMADEAQALQIIGSSLVCRLDRVGDIVCRNFLRDWRLTHKGPFRAFALDSETQGCGVAADGTVSCWNDSDKIAELCRRGSRDCEAGGVPPASEKFKQVTVYRQTGCGVTIDGRISCWGDPRQGFTPPPAGNDFRDVRFAGGGAICALRSDGRALCGAELAGPYQQVVSDYGGTCGLRNDGSVQCWGAYDALAMQPGTTGLAQISRWDSALCGLTKEGAARCWNTRNDVFMRVPPPAGPFKAIVNTTTFACGLRGDDEVECWGIDWGNGSGSETCLVEQAQLSIDGRTQTNLFWRPHDTRLSSDAGLRSAASSFGGLVTLGGAVPAPTVRDALGDAGVSVTIENSLWLLDHSDSQSAEVYCTGPRASGRITRQGDEQLVDWSDLSLLGKCPGPEAVAGSLSACVDSPACGNALTGTLRGETKNVAQRFSHGWIDKPFVAYADGSILLARRVNAQATWGLLITPADASGLSEVICIGSVGVDLDTDIWTLGNFTSLGRCAGAGGHTLKGCLRQ